MKKGEHYGIIPGCSKPSLWKPGAEKLAFTFRLRAQHDITILSLGNGHNEYQVKCTLVNSDSEVVGEGVGICSTMEGKYRYRTEIFDKVVPDAYWKTKDKALLGGPDCVIKKVDKDWVVFRRVETDNPADNYNTCIKMAKKRAFIDAILTTTAASDIFAADAGEAAEQEAARKKAQNDKEQNQDPADTMSTPKGPETLYDFVSAREKIEQGASFNGTLYKGGIIYINKVKFQVTAEECSVLKELMKSRTPASNTSTVK